MRTVNYSDASFQEWFEALEKRRTDDGDASRTVADTIISSVRRGGDSAVSETLAKFDGVAIAPSEILVRVDPSARVSDSFAAAIEEAISSVAAFHRRQRPESFTVESDGSVYEHLVRPLKRVGAYVPGGRAVYLSTLIMCAVPARLAGVEEIIVATTPRAAGTPELHYVCAKLGVREIYRCGGPAGIAALALGTASLRRVDKIVGPGNAFVAAAKQALSGTVGVDMVAGPTEVVIVADSSSDPASVAADLLAQSEHGTDSTAICVTDSPAFEAALLVELESQLAAAPGDSAARASIAHNGTIVQVTTLEEAVEVINLIAPEHVSVQSGADRLDLDSIENCGAIFVGRLAPVALGDYILGPNHVLPTGGAARFSSPLGVYDFVKRSNRITVSQETSARVSAMGADLASFEGLPMHARSIGLRTAATEVQS